ncbi:MAG: type II toxin-antitoxin system VapC family toxin [Isosphaeraceae bacterium]
MILLDTNILLRFARKSDPENGRVDAALNLLRGRGEALFIVAQNLYEFWATGTRPIAANGLGLSAAECYAEIQRIRMLFTFLPDHPDLYDEWQSLVVSHTCHGRVSFDARLVAAMKTLGLTQILTYNGADFARFPGLTILDPAALVPTIPPTPPPP